MNTNRINILNCPIDKLTNAETLKLIDEAIQKREQLHHTVVNASKLVMMQQDEQLHQSVVEADVINADGMAVVWASKLLGQPLPERVAGVDLMQSLVALSFEKGYKAYFLGAKQEVVAQVVDRYSTQYAPEIIAGFRNGYFNEYEEEQIARDIANSGANILFVAISSPKKENFLYQYREILQNVNFIMGVGGSFDVVAGKVNRAPLWMQKAGLEWFYRLAQEPKRMWKRYTVGNYRFIKLVVKEYFSKKTVKFSKN